MTDETGTGIEQDDLPDEPEMDPEPPENDE